MGDIVSRYYLCNPTIAAIYCKGMDFKRVRYYTDGPAIYSGQFYIVKEDYRNTLLLKDVDDDLKIMLALCDPSFREVDVLSILTEVHRDHWEIL